jgi:hypothetical protein
LSTDDPLQFHFTKVTSSSKLPWYILLMTLYQEPLLEEYSVAAHVGILLLLRKAREADCSIDI